MSTSPPSAIVVGGGVAGMAAAFRLTEAGFDVRVLEAGERVGGRMSTVRRDGYLIDPGASFLSAACTPMQRLIEDAGLSSEVAPSPSVFGIVRAGRVHRIAMDAPMRAAGTRLLSLRAKASLARVAYDIVRVRKRIDYADLTLSAPFDDESLERYARRRVNDEAYDYLVEPMSAACFGVGPLDATKASFFFMLAGFLFAGGCINSRSGIGFLSEGLARKVRAVELGARVERVIEGRDAVRVKWVDRHGVGRTDESSVAVIAVPAPVMLDLYPQLDGEARRILERVEYSSSVSVSFGLRRVSAEPAAVLIVPRREHPDVLVIVLEHNKAPGRAPAGRGLVTFDWQGSWSEAHWDDDAAVADATLTALARTVPGLVDPDDVEMTHITRWHHCLMRGRPGHTRDLLRLRELRAAPPSRVDLAGDYLGLSATGAAMCTGEAAAERLIAAHPRPSQGTASPRDEVNA